MSGDTKLLTMIDIFVLGARWSDKNPTHEVMTMLNTLMWYEANVSSGSMNASIAATNFLDSIGDKIK